MSEGILAIPNSLLFENKVAMSKPTRKLLHNEAKEDRATNKSAAQCVTYRRRSQPRERARERLTDLASVGSLALH